MDQTENMVDSGRTSKPNFLKMGLVAFLAVLFFGYPSSGPKTTNGPVEEAVADSVISSTLKTPSAFPDISIKNFGQMDAHFYRGAQPKPTDYKALAALGIKTIVDLRDDPMKYEKPKAEAEGMQYVNIRMSDRRKPSEDQIEAFMAVVNDSSNLPIYVHCAGGRHRTGLIGAVYRFNKYGWDFDQAYREMKNYDYYSRWGHGAIKQYVQEYFAKMEPFKPALPAIVNEIGLGSPASEPITAPPPPKVKE